MNLDAIKKKLNAMNEQKSKGPKKIWKPTGEGKKDVIRILPYKFDPENPFVELSFYYEFGKKTILSPSSLGNPDPILEFVNKLKKTGRKDDWKLGRKLEPKMRVFVPIIVRGEEEQGVKYWGFGKEVYQELLSIISDPDYGDLTDPTTGRDITVLFEAAEATGRSFASTKVLVKPNQTPATTDKKLLKQWVDSQEEISSIWTESSYSDLEKILSDYIAASDESSPDDETPIKGKTSSSVAEVEKEFGGLLEDSGLEEVLADTEETAPKKKVTSKKK